MTAFMSSRWPTPPWTRCGAKKCARSQKPCGRRWAGRQSGQGNDVGHAQKSRGLDLPSNLLDALAAALKPEKRAGMAFKTGAARAQPRSRDRQLRRQGRANSVGLDFLGAPLPLGTI